MSALNLVLHNEELLFSVLNHCDEVTRASFIQVSTSHHNLLTSEASFRWRVARLHVEYGIYHSTELSPNTTWRSMFLKNWPKRNLWGISNREESEHDNGSDGGQDDQFQLTVAARFRPKNQDNPTAEKLKKVALPLHQRLAMIKMNRDITCNKEAFQILTRQGGWFGKALSGDGQQHGTQETREDENTDDDHHQRHSSAMSMTPGVHMIDTENKSVVVVDRRLRQFNFDLLFGDVDGQKDVYASTAKPLIAEFINGYNVTCLAYGQTGSGKTFSMFGPSVHEANFSDGFLYEEGIPPESWGIVPRSCAEVFAAIKHRRQHLDLNMNVEVGISYVEIFGNDVSDLLRDGSLCGQSRVAAQRYVLDGSSEVAVGSLKDTLDLLDKGEKQKRKAATAINQHSSRAHTLFIVTLRQECVDTGVAYTSRLFLADLGGSEKIKKSQPYKDGEAKDSSVKKERVQEAVNINLGLLALKQCVEGLRHKRHVPYNDSKLTSMLSTGLGGSSKTAIIVCGAQESVHSSETTAAMRFGQTCRGISNTAKTNVTMLHSLLNRINDRIAECEQKIRDNERWEEVDVNRHDDDGNLVEVRKKTVVVGAEKYRLELNNLIKQKVELTGEDMDDLYGEDSSAVAGFGNFREYAGVKSENTKSGDCNLM